MSLTTPQFRFPKLLAALLFVAAVSAPISGVTLRKLDETSTPTVPGPDVKCAPCIQNSPPPPPPPSPPPPAPKKPPTQYCPPPPPSEYIYITGPPGNLYPVEQYFSGAGRSVAVGLPALIGWGLLGVLAF